MKTLSDWLRPLGLERYASVFAENEVGLEAIALLSENDLQELGVPLGPRRILLKAIADLNDRSIRGLTTAASGPEVRERATAALHEKHSPEVPSVAEGERRQLTVMFCDLVGSTALSEQLDPEELGDLVRRYQQAAADVIGRFEGYIAQYLGDGLLVYFGHPKAHEDDAQRAIRAGLDILSAISTLNARLVAERHVMLSVRIGIHTGVVVVGEVGTGERHERLALGDTPNLAARLQTLAEPDTLVISDRTHQLASGSFEYRDLGEQPLKGIGEPVRVWHITGLSAAASRFEAATQDRLTPLVGRELEIELLMDRWQLARDGDGQVVVLSGEPGLGKSRILSALRERLQAQGASTLRFQCSPYYVNTAFYPLTDHLERALRFGRDESISSKLDKLDTLVVDQLHRPLQDAALLALILSIPSDDRYPPLAMTVQRQKEETIRTLIDLIQAVARRQPSVMLFEDTHWIDPTTLEVLDLLVDRIRTFPMLLVVTHRPEFQSKWAGHGHVAGLALSRLTRAQSLTMVSRLTGNKVLPPELLAQIIARTDGVPLFVEELTKAILESGSLVDAGHNYEYVGAAANVSIPATLRDSLMARLDRFMPVKEIAQIGAAIGREFSYELVAAVAPMGKVQLDDALTRLTESGLAFRRGLSPEAVFTFKHALVQDAAYDSLLKSRRQELHGKIARVLEERFPESKDNDPELLAHHLTMAGMNEAAIPYWHKAGDLAHQRLALQESVSHLNKGLEMIRMMPPSPQRDVKELELRTSLGWVWIALRGWTAPEINATLIPALPLAKSLQRNDALLPILSGLSVSARTRGRNAESLKWVNEMFDAAEATGDKDLLVAGHADAMAYYFWLGDLITAQKHGDKVLALYAEGKYEEPNHHGHRPVALASIPDWPRTYVLNCASHWTWMLGYPDRAVRVNEAKDAHARRLGSPWNLCFALGGFGSFLFEYRSEPEVLLHRADECERIARENSLSFFFDVQAPRTRAVALIRAGELAQGTSELVKYVDPPATTLDMRPYFINILAEATAALGDHEEALRLIDEVVRHIEQAEIGGHPHYAETLRIKGWTLQQSGKRDEAERHYRAAINIAREQQAKSWELRASNALARLLGERGHRAEGRDLLAPIFGWFTEGFDTKDLNEAKMLLAELM